MNFLQDNKLHAKLIAEYCAVPLDFNFVDEAEHILSKLKVQTDILNVILVDKKGDVFASYVRNTQLSKFHFDKTNETDYFTDEYLYLYEDVLLKDARVGGLYLRVSKDILKQNLLVYTKSLLLILGSQLFIVYFLAFFLQRIITTPILTLNKFAQEISNKQDYSKRLNEVKTDETGILYSSFNLMLNQIQKRDEKINTDKLKLEIKNDEYIEINKKLIENNKELKIAKEKAEESEQLKSAFLANMSHEIRTPMNGILGFLDLLKTPNLSESKRSNYIDIVNKSGDRLLTTINDIIDISKIDAGQMIVIIEETDIIGLAKDLFSFFLIQCKEKGLRLNMEILMEDDVYITNTDSNKLNSILTNLIKNAIKFTQRGSILIELSLNGKYYKFSIIDTGIGIPENRRKAVFNRFEQADLDGELAVEGSGLGLSISKAYVEMLGGEIWFESKENVGTSFHVTLPLNN